LVPCAGFSFDTSAMAVATNPKASKNAIARRAMVGSLVDRSGCGEA
jgi:hypothetical protein